MSLKDILVYLDATPRCEMRLRLAASLAARHGAYLIGLFIAEVPAAELFRGATMAFLPVSPEQVVDRMRSEAFAAAKPIEAAFREQLRTEGLNGEWRQADGNRAAILAMHARYADLTVVGQPNRYQAHEPSEDAMLEAVLMSSGRPVLVVPFAGQFDSLGKRVLVGWNASREATRAIHDALPFLVRADNVTVLAINPRQGADGHGEVPAADICAHLARHGVKAEAAHTVARDISDGEALLSYAADIGADLIVSGGYGHSRVRETIFGGVTRTLVTEMTAPVLLSH
jgi:nucleotide-binding universal stress UspA family protein